MINAENRIGNFTSSEIYRLMTNDRAGTGFGKPALSYIEEKIFESELGRSLNSETDARSTSWGNLLEKWAFSQPDIFPLNYHTESKDTIKHPYLRWSGSPDGFFYPEKGVFDLKCPFTLKSFMLFRKAKTMADVREFHTDGDKYFWQLVSNACLSGADVAELIVFVPQKSQLDEIRQFHDGNPEAYWLNYCSDEHLPYVLDGFPNLLKFRFYITEEDKNLLTSRVKLAQDYLK